MTMTLTAAPDRALMSEAEAAAYLGLTADRLYRIRAGKPRNGEHLPAPPRLIKLTSIPKYRKADLDAWVEKNAAEYDRNPIRKGRGRPRKVPKLPPR